MEIIWLPATKQMTIEEYKSCYLKYIELRKKYKANKILLDETELFFTSNSKLQNWASNLINTNISSIAPYIAIVVNKEIIQQLLVKALIEEIANGDVVFLYFSSKKDAALWLMDDILTEAYQLKS